MLHPPDMAACRDLLGALNELSSVSTFLESRRCASPALSAEIQRLKLFRANEEMPIHEMKQSVKVLSAELLAHVTLDALVALRVFVQQGGKLGSRMFTLRFDAQLKSCAGAVSALPHSGLERASSCALVVAAEMEHLVSNKNARISLFECVSRCV